MCILSLSRYEISAPKLIHLNPEQQKWVLIYLLRSGLQVLCFYFIFTVFGTIGFGDIFAVNTTERVLSLFKRVSSFSISWISKQLNVRCLRWISAVFFFSGCTIRVILWSRSGVSPSGPHFSHDMLSLADILYFSFHSWSKLVWYYFISGDPHGVNLKADLLLLWKAPDHKIGFFNFWANEIMIRIFSTSSMRSWCTYLKIAGHIPHVNFWDRVKYLKLHPNFRAVMNGSLIATIPLEICWKSDF